MTKPFVSALPIFPVRLQTSIFGADELNFRVRDGNGWTLIAINTDSLFFEKKSKQKKLQNFLLLTVLFNDKLQFLKGVLTERTACAP